jgi:serine/threonine-protein kinase|nr:serine/threonine-protein kinase [Kofleriaceae bacterium]
MPADSTDPGTRVSGPGAPARHSTEADASAAVAGLPRSERYLVTAPVASGGMGEVLAAHDLPLAREVVIKRLRSSHPSPESITRFLREARIQGRLQHPSIVPVHDLAVDAEGRPFFAMRALPGKTLASILTAHSYSRAQLLRAFIDVCLAIELAHTNHVLHRDLKPANISLGEFGEVYVLDWGVARILGDDHPDTLDNYAPVRSTTTEVGAPRVTLEPPLDDWPLAGEAAPTLPGAILGTPGYMSPEQLRGDPEIGPASDIYALGCILFEMLAGEPLHPRNGPMASTATGADARPSRRVPQRDVSPELDAICVRATQLRPDDRYPTARALADAVQRYLDGDRDVARRRELAASHLVEARAALAVGGDDGRRDAIRLCGRALALDPESADAAGMLGHLVVSAPKSLPGELRLDLETKLMAEGRDHAKLGSVGIATYFLFLPLMFVIGITDWTWVIANYSLVVAAAAFTILSFKLAKPSAWRAWLTLGASAVLVALFARLIGPFVLPAGMANVSMAVGSTNPHIARRGKLVLAMFLVAALGPWALEYAGVLAPSYRVAGDGFLIFSPVLAHNPGPGQLAIAGYIVAVMVVMASLTFRVSRANLEARARLETQAWHLRQLMPSERASRGSVPPA